MKHLIIIGSGMAGLTAAQEARHRHGKEELSITIISREDPPCQFRQHLPALLAGAITEDRLLVNRQWLHRQSINLISPVEVDSILPQQQMVRFHKMPAIHTRRLSHAGIPRSEETESASRTKKQEQLHYDALILATGSLPVAPVIPDTGTPAAGSVFTLRTIQDVRSLRHHLALHRKGVAIMGGGLQGLKAAHSLMEAGAEEISILEISGYLLNRQLNRTASEMLRLHLEREEGLVVRTGIQVDTNELKSHPVGEVLRPSCKGDVKTLLYSMGTRAHLSLARDALLDCDKGIIIDERMTTSNPAIFAAGDCAQFQGVTWSITPAAIEQGKKAGQFATWHLFSETGRHPHPPAPHQQTIPRTSVTIGKREILSVGKAVLTVEEESSGRWKNHEIEATGKKSRSKPTETYVNLVMDTETNTIVGGLALGPRGTIRQWLSQMDRLMGSNYNNFIGGIHE